MYYPEQHSTARRQARKQHPAAQQTSRTDLRRLIGRVEAASRAAAQRKRRRKARWSPEGGLPRAERRSIRGLLHELEACYACASGFTSIEVLVALMVVGFVGLALLGHDVTGLLSGLAHHLLGMAGPQGQPQAGTGAGTASAGLVVAGRPRAGALQGAPKMRANGRTGTLRRLARDFLASLLAISVASVVAWAVSGAATLWSSGGLGSLVAQAASALHPVLALVSAHALVAAIALGVLVLLFAAPVFPSHSAMGKTHDERLAGTEERGWLVCHLLIVAVGLVFLGLATGAIPTGHTDLLGGVISHLMGSSGLPGTGAGTGVPSAASISGVMGR
jgi:hypothetical protein